MRNFIQGYQIAVSTPAAWASNRTTTVSKIIKYTTVSIYLLLYHKQHMYMYELVHEHVIYKVLLNCEER